jgi:hypothetical protein
MARWAGAAWSEFSLSWVAVLTVGCTHASPAEDADVPDVVQDSPPPPPPLSRESTWPKGMVDALRGEVTPAALTRLLPGARLERHPFIDSCNSDYFTHPTAPLHETLVSLPDAGTLRLIHTVDELPMSTVYRVVAVAAGPGSDVTVEGLRPRTSTYAEIAARFPRLVCRWSVGDDCGDHDGTVVMCAALGSPYMFEVVVEQQPPAVGPGGYLLEPSGSLESIYWWPNPSLAPRSD